MPAACCSVTIRVQRQRRNRHKLPDVRHFLVTLLSDDVGDSFLCSNDANSNHSRSIDTGVPHDPYPHHRLGRIHTTALALAALLAAGPLLAATLQMNLQIKNRVFEPTQLQVPAGTKVKLLIHNADTPRSNC